MPEDRFITFTDSHKFRFIISRFVKIAIKKRKNQEGREKTPLFGLVYSLTLDRALDHAFDDVFLRGEVEHDDWDNADDDQRHDGAQVHMTIASL